MSLHIAIIGSGQLARMMALDGIPMGIRFSFLAETSEDTRCVDSLGDIVIRQAAQSAEELYTALGEPDIITVEKEHVDIPLLRDFKERCLVHPNPDALEKFKNRHTEKQFLQSLGIPIAPFVSVTNKEQFEQALSTLNQPIFLKSEEEGYDGYNQHKLTSDNQQQVLDQITFPSQWVAEAYIPFEREISFIAARSRDNSIVVYPASENDHHNGTLMTSLVPAPNVTQAQLDTATQYLTDIFNAVDYVGVICMECFVDNGKILVNEIAPRVHNSGHWTSKGALTSQFENHIRAVAGLPLGSTKTHGISGMLNLLGVTLTAAQASDFNAYLTLYGKTTKPRRKLGHVTVNGDSYEAVIAQLQELKTLAYGEED